MEEKILKLIADLKVDRQSLIDQTNGAVQAISSTIARLEEMLKKDEKEEGEK